MKGHGHLVGSPPSGGHLPPRVPPPQGRCEAQQATPSPWGKGMSPVIPSSSPLPPKPAGTGPHSSLGCFELPQNKAGGVELEPPQPTCGMLVPRGTCHPQNRAILPAGGWVPCAAGTRLALKGRIVPGCLPLAPTPHGITAGLCGIIGLAALRDLHHPHWHANLCQTGGCWHLQ